MKEKARFVFIAIAYTIIFAPYIFNIYYSMPANDDFGLAINWWGKGIIGEAFMRAAWNYMNWFGQSGILAVLVQVLFNPLHWFNNMGHSMGICLILWNGLIIFGVLNGFKRIIMYFVDGEGKYKAEIATLVLTTIITSTYYYNDIYNWWSGVGGYSLMMMVAVQSLAYTCEYVDVPSKKKYIMMIVLGTCACTSVMYCVPVGLMYLFIMIFLNEKTISFKTIALPFIFYVIAGISTVVAPGNFARMNPEDAKESSIVGSVIVAFRIIIQRLSEALFTKWWVVALLAIIFILGFSVKAKRQPSFLKILLGVICIVVSAAGAELPYIYGQNKHASDEFAPRALYVMDYIIWLGLVVTVFLLGMYFASKTTSKAITKIVFLIAIAVGTVSILSGNIKYEIHIDMMSKKALIIQSYDLWNGIFDEIEAADSNKDIVVVRPQLTWCQYVYYPGIDEELKDPIGPDDGYANCNQCAAKYFGKKMVAVVFE